MSVAHDPKVALLIGRHANTFHGGKGTAFGSPEFLFNIAVANAMTGSKVALDGGGTADAARVADTARHWRPLVAELDMPPRPAIARASPSAATAARAG